MENASEALKMAGAVLLFVLALSIIIFYFGQVRQTSDTILNYRDRETTYIDGEYYYETSGTERKVSIETIIPSIFRAYLENYKIVFEYENDIGKELYSMKDENGKYSIKKYCLDLETKQGTKYKNVVLANDNQKAEFLSIILFRDYSRFNTNQSNFEKKYNVRLSSTSLYDQLTSAKKITEYLGVYYQNDAPNVPDIMKTEKRIVTYKVEY